MELSQNLRQVTRGEKKSTSVGGRLRPSSAGFWNKKLGILGALGSIATFVCTVTIIPFMPDGCAASAGGFPAMIGNVAFLMKDVVLLAVSFYLLKHDLARVMPTGEIAEALYSKPKRSYSHV